MFTPYECEKIIRELRFEEKLRRRVFPRLVAAHRMTQHACDERIRLIENAVNIITEYAALQDVVN
jgi:hypothetical protein